MCLGEDVYVKELNDHYVGRNLDLANLGGLHSTFLTTFKYETKIFIDCINYSVV